MASPASPALRALRRLVARDSTTPIQLDPGGLRSSLVASLRSLARPFAAAAGEVLGDPHAPAAGVAMGTYDAGIPAAQSPEAAATSSRSRLAERIGSRASRVTRHRRLAPLAACLLLVAAAAASALPPVSAAGAPAPTPSVITGLDANANADANANGSGDASANGSANGSGRVDQTPPDQGVDIYAGDGSVYNTIQAGDVAVASGGFQIYVVKGGDGLNKIAAKFGIGVTTLYWANRSKLPDLTSIQIGLRLLIPPVNGVVVTVKAKDSLSALAQKYKVSVQAIVIANGLTDETVTVGQQLVIPGSAPALPTPKPGCAAGCGGSTWNGGKLRWPVVGTWTISQYYSASRHPALDFAANTGTTVVAAAGGTVIFAGWKRSGGGYGGGIEVWISHGGKLYTTYNHLSAEFVSIGQTVSAGQHIGNVGRTGNATGPHLHFEVWVCYPWGDGTTGCARNPLNYLR